MSTVSLWNEFKPSILFLAKFVIVYLIGNVLYGLFVTSYEPGPDPATHLVSVQTAWILEVGGFDVSYRDQATKATTQIIHDNRAVLAIYEGCNGINTAIVFLAFIVAFGPLNGRAVWFMLAGLIAIHMANLARIVLLFLVAEYNPEYMYFTHKYLFTAFLYLVIFVLWFVWVRMNTRKV